MDNSNREEIREEGRKPTTGSVLRRTVLRAAGASGALALGVGTAAAGGEHATDDSGNDSGGSSGRAEPTNPNEIDPIFGYASAEQNPCLGDSSEDCFDAFTPPVRPDHEIEMEIDIPELLFALGAQGVLSPETVAEINEAVDDGSVDEGELSDPDAEVTVELPDGSTETVTVGELAELLADTTGFHFEPAGITVSPGDVVLYSAETPDHGVTAYHELHGRQNRVPDGVGPVSSPIVPVGGYWLYRFDTEGVYDFYCPPHEPFGMVHRVVVTNDDDGDAPEPSIEDTGRPPVEVNLLPTLFGGLDPDVPSALAALESDALHPENVVSEGAVPWTEVVEEYRSG
jgi:plastocyanin